MNFGSTTINSLQSGGVANGTTSELTDGGNAEDLTILNGFNIGASGDLILSGASTITAPAVSNSGHVVIGSTAILNLTGQPLGITDVAVHSSWEVSGNFELGGVANIAFANLTSVEGIVDLENGQNWAISPIGGTLTVGDAITSTAYLEDGHGTTITINGNVLDKVDGAVGADTGGKIQLNGNADNFGTFYTHGGSTFNISGTLTNEASGGLELEGMGDKASIGNGVSNAGYLSVEGGSTLAVTGGVDNSGLFVTNFNNFGGNNTITVSGMLTNESDAMFELLGPKDMATIGSLNNAGFVDVEGGTTLTILGDVSNSGFGANGIYTSFNGTGGNALNIDGSLNNSGMLGLENADTAAIGNGLTNSGTVDLEHGSTLTITGNSSNSGNFYTDLNGLGGNNTVSITGTLDNTGLIWLQGAGDKATITGAVTNELDAELFLFGGSKATMAGLTNAGTVDVEGGSTLQVNGNATNSGNLYADQQGAGGNNTVNITGMLTNGPTGTFELFGPGDTATLGGLGNSGMTDVERGSTLQINGNATNSGNLYTDFSGLGGNNTVNITGTLDNTGLVWLKGAGDTASITGIVTNELDAEIFSFGGSQVTMGGLSNAGTVDVEGGSTLQVNGDATNSGNLYTNQQGAGGNNTLNITGMLTNEMSGALELFGPKDMATIGSLNNAGFVDVEGGSTLTILGDVTNSGAGGQGIYTSFNGSGGNTLNIDGNLDNSGRFGLEGADTATIGKNVTNSGLFALTGDAMATIDGNLTSNTGTVDLENASTLLIKGDADNAGTLSTSGFGGTGGNSLTITGLLTNELGGTFTLNGPGDTATIGSVSNSGKFTVAGGSIATLGGLTNSASGDVEVGNGSTLQINGDVNNSNIIETAAQVPGGGNTVNITGTLTNQGANGFGLFGAGDKATIGGNLINSAIVTVENGSTLQVSGNVDNSGTLVTNFFANGGGNTITVNGLLTNEATGQINLNGPGDLLQALAGLTNNGSISVNNGSSIDPPFLNNGGHITIDSTSKLIVGTGMPMGLGYIQLANGTLGESINSLISFGVINVNGSALLAGTLDILLKAGYNPGVGTEFTILTSNPGQLNGTFSSILNDIFNGGTEMWAVNYDYADGLLELTAQPNNNPVPEPATLLVLLPALLGAGYGLRKKLLR